MRTKEMTKMEKTMKAAGKLIGPLALIAPLAAWLTLAGCELDLNSYSWNVDGSTQATITTHQGVRYPATMSVNSETSDQQQTIRTLSLNLGFTEYGSTLGELWLALDQPLDEPGQVTVSQVMLRLAGSQEVYLSLPAAGWSYSATLRVLQVSDTPLPDKDERGCVTYNTRSIKLDLSLRIDGPAGERYTVKQTDLDVVHSYRCEAFHM